MIVDYHQRVGENKNVPSSLSEAFFARCGPVAQLGARFHGMEEVVGSNPTRSTSLTLMTSVCILQSESTLRFYIGCAGDPLARLVEHERGQTKSTRGRGPWTLVHEERFESLAEARRREAQLKSWKSHRSLQELIAGSKRAMERAPA